MRITDIPSKIEKVDRIIDDTFDQPDFGIDHICRELGVSRSQLYRLVKECTGLSVSLYIRKRKMIKAAELLISSKMKTSEISYLLGIDSPQSFSRYFAQQFGVSPTAYRRQEVNDFDAVMDVPEEPLALASLPVETAAESEPPKDIPFTKRPGTVSRRVTLLIFGGLFLFIMGAVVWHQSSLIFPPSVTDIGVFENSIVVMPFKNLGSQKTDYLCVGVRDQIHGSLALIDKLKVIATSSADSYKDRHTPVNTIAEELGVNYLLEGSVLVVDQHLRIMVELVSAIDSRTVWTKTYDSEMTAVFGLFNDVAREVSHELKQKLSENFERQKNRRTTRNLFAYNEYLKGRQLIISRKKEQLLASVVHLNKAVQADPGFSDAYAQLSVAYHLMAENGVMPRDSCVKLGERYALAAIKLDPDCGTAFAGLANLYREQQKWEQAEAAYRIALKHQPNDALINYWFSLLLRTMGNVDEAMRYSLKAVAIDPLHPVINAGHVVNCVYAKEPGLAQKGLDEGKDLFNETFPYHMAGAIFYTSKFDYKRAIQHVLQAERLNPGVKMEAQIMFLKARDGQTREVLGYLKSLPETSEYDGARCIIYSGLRDKERSIHYLLKATSGGRIHGDIKVSAFFDILHGDRRYEMTLRKFGL